MRSAEVVANTTWESLQTVGADYCVLLGLISTLHFDLKMFGCLVGACHCPLHGFSLLLVIAGGLTSQVQTRRIDQAIARSIQ